MKEKIYSQDYSTQQGSCSDSMEKSKALQISKRQQNSAPPDQFAINAKGTSLGGEEKATTRNKKITNEKAHH